MIVHLDRRPDVVGDRHRAQVVALLGDRPVEVTEAVVAVDDHRRLAEEAALADLDPPPALDHDLVGERRAGADRDLRVALGELEPEAAPKLHRLADPQRAAVRGVDPRTRVRSAPARRSRTGPAGCGRSPTTCAGATSAGARLGSRSRSPPRCTGARSRRMHRAHAAPAGPAGVDDQVRDRLAALAEAQPEAAVLAHVLEPGAADHRQPGAWRRPPPGRPRRLAAELRRARTGSQASRRLYSSARISRPRQSAASRSSASIGSRRWINTEPQKTRSNRPPSASAVAS